jgi:hypothetical protein
MGLTLLTIIRYELRTAQPIIQTLMAKQRCTVVFVGINIYIRKIKSKCFYQNLDLAEKYFPALKKANNNELCSFLNVPESLPVPRNAAADLPKVVGPSGGPIFLFEKNAGNPYIDPHENASG